MNTARPIAPATTDAAAAPPPSPALLAESDAALRTLQLILAEMGKDERRKSEAFMYIMGKYKELGTNLHNARKRVPPPPAPKSKTPAPTGYSPTALGRARRPAVPAGPAATGATALANAQRPYGGQPAHQSPPQRGGTVPIVPLAPRGPAAPAAQRAPLAAPLPRARPAAAPQPERVLRPEPIPHPAPLGPSTGAEQLLHLPKLVGTLGPPGSYGIDFGPPVAHLQELLQALGYEVEINGEYDVPTFRAVQELQKVRQLPVNGMVGLETRKLLNEMVTG